MLKLWAGSRTPQNDYERRVLAELEEIRLSGGIPDFTKTFDHCSPMCHFLARRLPIFGGMRTYYCNTLEEALKRAKKAGKESGCHYGGITFPSGRKGFAIYREGKIIEKYTA